MPQPLGTEEKITFVADLMKSVRDEIVNEIRTGKIPESWTGQELRFYLYRAFDQQVLDSGRRSAMRTVIHNSTVLGLKY